MDRPRLGVGLGDDMTAPAFRAATNAFDTLTVDVPTHVNGDLLLVAIVRSTPDTSVFTLPAGWTLETTVPISSVAAAFYARRVADSEPASYTFGPGTTGSVAVIASCANPNGLRSSRFESSPSNGTFSIGAMVSDPGDLVVALYGAISGGTPTITLDGFTVEHAAATDGRTVKVGTITSTGTVAGPYDVTVSGSIAWAVGRWDLTYGPAGGWGVGQIRMGAN